MNKAIMMAAGLAAGMFCSTAVARTANDLLNECNKFLTITDNPAYQTSMTDAYEAGRCIAYIEGASDILQVEGTICLEEEVTSGQLARIVVNKAKASPYLLSKAPATLVYSALAAHYLCPKPKQ